MKEYTREQMQEIERKIDDLISVHDRWEIRELCQIEEYALYYFINKALDQINTLEHIKNIIKER